MKNWQKFILILAGLLVGFYVIAAPASNILRNILPEISGIYEIGTTTALWLRLYTQYASTTSITATSSITIADGLIATSTLYGSVNSTSTLYRLSANVLNVATTTATSTFSNGIQLSAGCYRLADGTCAGTSGITSLNGLTGSSQTFTNDTNVTISSAGTAHTLGWSGTLSTTRGGLGGNFGASTGALSISSGAVSAGTLTVANGGTNAASFTGSTVISANGAGTTLISSTTPSANQFFTTLTTATSTFLGGFSTQLLNVTLSTASSTFSGGITIAGGVKMSTYNCSIYGNGGKLTTDANGYLTCGADSGGGGATVNNGTANRLAYYSGASTVDSGTNLFWNNTNLGVGTTTIAALSIFAVQGNAIISGTTTVGELVATSSASFANGTSTITAEYARFRQAVVMVQRSTTLSLSNDTGTALGFDVELYDPNNMHVSGANNTRITANVEGVYQFNGSTNFQTNATGQRGCWFQRNGLNAERYGGNLMAGQTGNGNYVNCSALIRLSVGDYVEFIVSQNSGGALNANDITSWLAGFTAVLVGQ